ncbi:MAG: GTPase ObgE [Candidatus Colwellbacteria bacterium]|nr:GTPase ObgE [Candidatus Colwellbacteria bacterium]
MLIDEVKIRIKAGDGGKGAIAFNKNMMSLGPAGGSGGKGGNIWFEGTSDIGALNQFRFKKEVMAENGQDGRGQFVDGKDGRDTVLLVPVGTVIRETETGKEKEITKIGERVLVAKGGRGGKGNFLFRSPKRTSPKIAQPGKPGESLDLELTLKMISDVGLVGLPNAGKTSLLNELTRAGGRVGNYAFTTIEPNLGVYYGLIISDIPGLIEGASAGKGLGMKFLRHIERTNVIFHLISAESENPVSDYKTIKTELEKYNKKLIKKKEFVFLTKSDLAAKNEVEKKMEDLKKNGIKAVAISIHDIDAIGGVKKMLDQIIKDKTAA